LGSGKKKKKKGFFIFLAGEKRSFFEGKRADKMWEVRGNAPLERKKENKPKESKLPSWGPSGKKIGRESVKLREGSSVAASKKRTAKKVSHR